MCEVVRDKTAQFDFKLSGQKDITSFEFVSKTGGRNLSVTSSPQNLPHELTKKIAQIQYISAARGGMNDVYPIPDEVNYSDIGVGTDGKYAGYWLDFFTDDKVDKSKSFKGIESDKFRDQVNAWLDFVVPATTVHVEKFESHSVVGLRFQLSESLDKHSPANVGFGISYVFPIIIALFSATKGDCVIIDSPESHLHPRAQSRVGYMIAKLAASGIQIILETHSDHVLNGIRIGVLEQVIRPDQLSILFFSEDPPKNFKVVNTKIDIVGQFEDWPDGFFDQKEKDLIRLIEGR